jgi:ubiquitin-activating enzyme E1
VHGVLCCGGSAAKNVILAGVKSVGVLDVGLTALNDLGSQFYLSEKDIGRPRGEACVEQLRALNSYVDVHAVNEPLTIELLKKGKYDVVVLTGYTQAEQLALNEYTHAHGIKLVSADCAGAFGCVFVDFGDAHVVSDRDGEQPRRGLVSHITNANPGIVTCHEESRHFLADGDYVTFEEIEGGMAALNGCSPQRVKFISPYSFSIGDTSHLPAFTGVRGYFQEVKMPMQMAFKPLSQCLTDPPIIEDWFGTGQTLHALYAAVSKFRETHGGSFPRPDYKEDADAVVALAVQFAATMKGAPKIDEALAARLARCSGAEINPMAAVLGGIVGQEVLKAASGKFGPIQQFYYFDASAALPPDSTDFKEFAPMKSRYDDQIAVLGRTLHERLTAQRYFVVGAGAIGCEMLKNFALMGVATKGNGHVFVTDMDSIEKVRSGAV